MTPVEISENNSPSIPLLKGVLRGIDLQGVAPTMFRPLFKAQ
jgi:hypothetical protein